MRGRLGPFKNFFKKNLKKVFDMLTLVLPLHSLLKRGLRDSK